MQPAHNLEEVLDSAAPGRRPRACWTDWPGTVLFLAAFGVILALFEPLQWAALTLGRRAHEKCVVALNRCLFFALKLTGLKVVLEIHPQLSTLKMPVVISNHQSMFDIPILHCIFSAFYPRFVAKQELARWLPSVSFNLRHGENAVIDRSNPVQAVAEIQKLGKRMKERGFAVVLFPEGTRAREGALKKFRPAGVVTLLQSVPEASVVPAALDGSWKIAFFGCLPIPRGIEVRVVIGPALERKPGADPKDVVEEAYAWVRGALERLRAG